MALIEEVWGSLTPSSPPEPKKKPIEPHTPTSTPPPLPQPDIASTTTQPDSIALVQETFQVPQSKPKKNLTLFLAVLITGICSIYAVDMFAETIRGS